MQSSLCYVNIHDFCSPCQTVIEQCSVNDSIRSTKVLIRIIRRIHIRGFLEMSMKIIIFTTKFIIFTTKFIELNTNGHLDLILEIWEQLTQDVGDRSTHGKLSLQSIL